MHKVYPSMPPGAIIGYRKNGRPIHVIAGGSGEGDEGGSAEGQDAGNGTADGSSTGDGNGSGSRDDDGGRDDRGRSAGSGSSAREGGNDDGKTERTVAAIRQEFKDERAKRQAAEQKVADIQTALDADKAERAKQMDALAIALGVKSGDEPPDPEKLAAELKSAQEKAQAEIGKRDTAIRAAQIELAVLRSAGKNGANGDALLDSRSFMNKAGKLDPSSDSFGDDLTEAIKDAVEAGPQYKAAAPAGGNAGDSKPEGGGTKPKPPARSSGEHTTPGGNRQWTVEEAKAIAKSDPRALQKAIGDGLLTDIGYPPPR